MKASLSVLCLSILLADGAAAADRGRPAAPARAPSVVAAAHDALVQVREGFLAEWTEHERRRSRFSRVSMPPDETRARLLDQTPRRDARGETFFAFVIDTRERGGEASWSLSTMTGCIYPERGQVYVRRGGDYRTAESFLGKKRGRAPEHACAGDAVDTAADGVVAFQVSPEVSRR